MLLSLSLAAIRAPLAAAAAAAAALSLPSCHLAAAAAAAAAAGFSFFFEGSEDSRFVYAALGAPLGAPPRLGLCMSSCCCWPLRCCRG